MNCDRPVSVRSFARYLFVTAMAVAVPASAAILPAGFAETALTTSLSSATAMAIAPDGRILVCQQGGALRVVKNGALLAQPFLSLTVSSSGERGLLGVAVDPNFTANNFVYVYYTSPSPAIHNRVSRFTANGDTAVPGSETILLDLDNLSGATNHNGGALHFGQDGKLYIASGDNDTGSNAQTLSNLLGKVMRINSDGTIPEDNPFYLQATGRNRAIWTLGLRNPFTFAFQNGSGRLFINDVGENTWEEINDGFPGANYGWPATEGETTNPLYVSPLFVYGHGTGPTVGCSIAGGAFYNPATVRFPASYFGKYFFADFCGGWIRVYDPATDTATGFATGAGSLVDLQVSDAGKLYYLNRSSLFEVDYLSSAAPQIVTQPLSQTIPAGLPVTFSVTASGTAPLTYQWQRDNVPIAGATSPSYTIASVTPADSGAQFRCVVSNAFGSATSDAAILTVAQPCSVETNLSYQPDTLTVGLTVGTPAPSRLVSALFSMRTFTLLWNVTIPATSPPANFSMPVSLAPSGTVGVLTTVNAIGGGGARCADWKTIFTGGSGASPEELWRQVERSGLLNGPAKP
ncbi:MAG: PQQ-dependent sugar dehydrogenase [Bryobacteraceae bacterium]